MLHLLGFCLLQVKPVLAPKSLNALTLTQTLALSLTLTLTR